MLNQDLSAAQIAKITGLSEQDIASMLPAEKATSAQPAQTNTVTQSTPEVSATQPKVSTKEQTWQALLTAQKEQSANCGPLLQSIFGKTAISTEEDMKLAKSSLDNFISTWHGEAQPTLTDYVAYLTKTVEQAKSATNKVEKTEEQRADVTAPKAKKKNIFQRFWGKVTGKDKKEKATKVVAETSPKTTVAENTAKSNDATAASRSTSTPIISANTPEISAENLYRVMGTSSADKTNSKDDTKSALQLDATLTKVASKPDPVAYYNNNLNYISNEEIFAKAEAQNRLNAIADASEQTNPVEEDIANDLSTQAKQDFIDAEYAKLVAGKSGKNQTCSLQELYNSGVITQDDVQAVLSEDPSMLSNLSAGSFNNKLSKAQASKCEDSGSCLLGTRKSLNKLGIHYIDWQYCNAVKDTSVNQTLNGASQSLDAAKRYCAQKGEEYPFTDVQISLPANNKQASAFLKTNLPKGQLLVFDHRTAAEIAAERKRNPNSKDLRGMQYGHICILNGSREFVSDIKENTIHTTRYGNLTVPLHYTTQSNEEFTKALLAQAYDRQENERMLAAAKTQQNSTTLATVTNNQGRTS
jgi:hypothetical protein